MEPENYGGRETVVEPQCTALITRLNDALPAVES